MSGHILSGGRLTVHGRALAAPVAIAVPISAAEPVAIAECPAIAVLVAVAELTMVAIPVAECTAVTVLIAVLCTVNGPTYRLPEVREPILLGRLSACVCSGCSRLGDFVSYGMAGNATLPTPADTRLCTRRVSAIS
jgi:hypothetical protein